MRDLIRFIVTLIDRKGLPNFPKILIVGEKKLPDTDLEKLINHDYLEKKIFYLSAEEGLDRTAF